MQNKVTSGIVKSRVIVCRIIAESLVIFFVFLFVFFRFMGLRTNEAYRVDGLVRSRVMTADGRTEAFSNNYFGSRKKGDTVTLNIGRHNKRFSEAAALCFHAYNAEVTVYCGGQEIYSRTYGSSVFRGQVGHRFYKVPLPADYCDGSLGIVLRFVEDNTDASLQNIYIYPATEADRYFINGHEFEFFVFSFILCASVFLLVLMLMRSIRIRRVEAGLYLAIFCVAITCWYMGFNGFFYNLIGSEVFCANVEYVMIYTAPVPLVLYLASVMNKKWYRRLSYAGAAVFGAEFAIAMISNNIPNAYSYSDLLPILHFSMGVIFTVLAVFLYTDRKQKSLPRQILRIGLTVGIALGMTELLRILLNQFWGQKYHFLSYSIASFGIIAIVCSLLLSFGAQLASDYAEEMERRELQRLAYIDTLTGVPNRASCYREIESMRKSGRSAYVMIFVDVNDLKKTNDGYGHEEGDRLIQEVAGALGRALPDSGFFGRWGGDEFIACVFGNRKNAEKAIDRFRGIIDERNAKHALPFEISVAVGTAESTEAEPLEYMDAINMADDRMYEQKKAMKKAR